jgi:hypothetical protein
MNVLFDSLVNTTAIWKIVAVAVVAGVALVGVYAFSIVSADRFVEKRLAGRTNALEGAVASFGVLVCLGAIALGIYAMATTKK